MPATSDLDRVSMVVLRYLRNPIFVLIVVYAIGITGMALIPGEDAEGNVEYMSLFHAFYFFTYTATTTGFGEIPQAFTDTQRLWTIFCLYIGVVAWLYAIGSIIRLMQNPHFLIALSEHQFAHAVKRINQPFFIICGFGDTGSLLARGLSDNDLGAVVLDTNPERIKALTLRDYRVKMPAFLGDPCIPKHLVDAGVRMPNCRAVIVLACDEATNLRISIMVRSLNPGLHILSRTTSEHHREQLSELGNVTVINPFEIFSQLLSMVVKAPRLHNLNSCLVHAIGVKLGQPLNVPSGDWILCGYGRMGQWLHKSFAMHGIRTVIIDPDIAEVVPGAEVIRGHAGRQTLQEAGIDQAVGVVAGTDNDHDNLSILMSARALKPDAFIIVRQNSHQNQIAFDSAKSDLILQPSLTTARRILKFLISPLVQTLVDYLFRQGEAATQQLVERLYATIGYRQPHLWHTRLGKDEAAEVVKLLHTRGYINIGELTRNPHNLDKTIDCIVLVIQRGNKLLMLPDDSEQLLQDDELLVCGTVSSKTMLSATMNNSYTLNYLITGIDAPRGYVFQWLEKYRHPVS